jgi:hypothetical protein
MLTQIKIDKPKQIKPASDLVTNKNRDFSRDFYIRERRPRAPFFVMDETLKAGLKSFAVSAALIAIVTLITAALVLDESEIRAFLWSK